MKSGTIKIECLYLNIALRTRGVIGVFTILFRRGSRRLAAGFCALVLVAALVAFPVRAHAMSATMAVVGGAVVVSAALVACGIYPYVSEDGQTFGEWGAERLSDLWAQYVSSFEGGSTPSGGTVQTFQEIRAYITGQTLVISRSVWEMLQSFIVWIKSTFSLTDSREGVRVGVYAAGYYSLPVGDFSTVSALQSEGLRVAEYTSGGSSVGFYVGSNSADVRGFFLDTGDWTYFYGITSSDSYPYYFYCMGSFNYTYRLMNGLITVDGVTYHLNNGVGYSSSLFSSFADSSALYTSTLEEAVRAVYGSSGVFEGITVDTATLGALPDMAANADYMGLAVSPGTVEGVAAPMTPQSVQRIIQQGVIDRGRPVVTPVDVTIAAGTDIDAETGVLTENPVTVELPQTVAIDSNPSAWQIQDLQTVFPFSIPWDIANVYMALNASPVRPSFTGSVRIPVLDVDVPFTIGVPDAVAAQVDSFAALFRGFLLVVLCVGTLLFVFERFHF